MKSIIFHVGAAKTASTSIQMALSKHSRYLNRRGFYIPRTDKSKHPELSFYSSFDLFDSYSVYTNYLPKNFDRYSSLLNYFHRVSLGYIEAFLASDCHTLILTDELLPYYCNTVDKIQRLSSLFPSDLNIRFIYYTRPPGDMYISLYSTLVKVNQTSLWPHQFSLPTDNSNPEEWIVSPEIFDHHNFISNIKAVFGDSSISVFSFSSILESKEYLSPVHHFFAILGIDKHDLAIDRVSNPRLDYVSLFILSFLNSIARRFSDERVVNAFNLVRSSMIPVLESISQLGFYSFPSRSVLRDRSLFDKIFS